MGGANNGSDLIDVGLIVLRGSVTGDTTPTCKERASGGGEKQEPSVNEQDKRNKLKHRTTISGNKIIMSHLKKEVRPRGRFFDWTQHSSHNAYSVSRTYFLFLLDFPWAILHCLEERNCS